MEYTQNYQLPLWDKEDAIKRTDFNDNNSKIDAALAAETTARENAVAVAKNEAAAALAAYKSSNDAALAAEVSARGTLAATVAKCGNCKIVCGNYVGTGVYSSANPKTLDFGGRPILVMVFQQENGYILFMGYPTTYGQFQGVNGHENVTLIWNDTGVSWYTNNIDSHMNRSNCHYYYFALLAADE